MVENIFSRDQNFFNGFSLAHSLLDFSIAKSKAFKTCSLVCPDLSFQDPMLLSPIVSRRRTSALYCKILLFVTTSIAPKEQKLTACVARFIDPKAIPCLSLP